MSGSMLSHVLDIVRRKAFDFKGSCTFEFSQSVPPVSTLIGADPAVAAGVCQALVNSWIAEHAAGGSMWNTLYPAGPRGRANTAGIDRAALAVIIAEQKAGGVAIPGSRSANAAVGGYLAQARFNEMWLARKGLAPWETSTLGVGAYADVSSASRHLCQAVCDYRPSNGAYLNIALQRVSNRDGGHAIGAFVGGLDSTGKRDYLLFDPNVGEFHFEAVESFRRWLGEGLLRSMSQGASYDYKAFTIAPFATRMRR